MSKESPKFLLEGNRWKIENQKNKNDFVVNISDKKQSVYIDGSESIVVTVKGKFTNITVDKCKKTAIICDDLIGSVEIVNSVGTQVQANGAVPTVTVDKSSGVTIYLQSAEGKKASIITSNSSEVNVITPGKTANDDPVEQAIPSQFLTVFGADGKLVTKPTEHVGV